MLILGWGIGSNGVSVLSSGHMNLLRPLGPHPVLRCGLGLAAKLSRGSKLLLCGAR